MNQMGFLIDGVLFCADVVFPEAAIEKYRIPYLFGLTQHIASLDRARGIDADFVVPGHGPIEPGFESPYQRNRAVVDSVLEVILHSLSNPQSADDVAAIVFRTLDVPIVDHAGYFLLRPTISAYLSHLHRSGLAHLEISNGAALWRRT
jgi:glyoxylase-like metal-dependent hydrolase (beta-lactamase superfamily II)